MSKGFVFFFHPDYIDRRIEDVYALAPKEREALRIVLETGHKVTGTVFDVAGKPVPNAMIKAIRKDGTHRKATMTDANGKFALRGLSEGLTMLERPRPGYQAEDSPADGSQRRSRTTSKSDCEPYHCPPT